MSAHSPSSAHGATTYLLLQQGLADARRAEALETRIDAQKVLSTKIPLLVAESLAGGAAKRVDLRGRCARPSATLGRHGELVRLSAPLPAPGSRGDLPRPGQLLFEAPVHLDRLLRRSPGAARCSPRNSSMHRPPVVRALPSPASEQPRRRRLANATLSGYAALGTHMPPMPTRGFATCSHPPHAVLRHPRRHRAGGAVHLPANVARPSCARRMSLSTRAIRWPSSPCMTG